MDHYALIMAEPESDDMFIYDMGTKEAMEAAFTKVVTDSEEDGNFYLMRVIKSAEITNSGDLEVLDHGDEDESSS